MAVFRVERNSGYTVMSNHHLRNKELTLKAKGLLSQMLSLPEDWDYTLAGLSHINRESIDAIRTAVWELEKAGYTLYQIVDSQSNLADEKSSFNLLGKIENTVSSSEEPKENFQANDDIVGAAVYQYGDNIVVEFEGKYWLYEHLPFALTRKRAFRG